MIQTYFDQFKQLLDSYAATPFVLDTQVSFDLRPGNQGYLLGFVLFRDRSRLHFREYLDADQNHVTKLMYSYHYQTATGQLVFRYDNARHKPALPEIEHKHTSDDVIGSQAPTIEVVLLETLVTRGWV